MIEELAVGAQHKLPYLHVVVNNSYLGLIRQAQRGFKMDFEVSLAFENVNAPEVDGYGVDHVAAAEGLGCKAIRGQEPERVQGRVRQGARADGGAPGAGGRSSSSSSGSPTSRWAPEIHKVNEFEEILCLTDAR